MKYDIIQYKKDCQKIWDQNNFIFKYNIQDKKEQIIYSIEFIRIYKKVILSSYTKRFLNDGFIDYEKRINEELLKIKKELKQLKEELKEFKK